MNKKNLYILCILSSFLIFFNNCSSTDVSCGQTSFTTTEPGNDDGNMLGGFTNVSTTNFNDYGITLKPGCTYTISGAFQAGDYDYFKYNTGDTSTIIVKATWDSGQANHVQIYLVDKFDNVIEDQENPLLGLDARSSNFSTSSDVSYLEFPVYLNNATRYLVLEEDFLVFLPCNYTVTITAY